MVKNSGESQTIEQLQARYEGLNEQKIKVSAQREHAQQRLEELKTQAKEQYGSDDVEQLAVMLKQMKSKNEEMRSQYQASLDGIDQDLAAINEKFATTQEEQ